jgi:hypothetical protein
VVGQLVDHGNNILSADKITLFFFSTLKKKKDFIKKKKDFTKKEKKILQKRKKIL